MSAEKKKKCRRAAFYIFFCSGCVCTMGDSPKKICLTSERKAFLDKDNNQTKVGAISE